MQGLLGEVEVAEHPDQRREHGAGLGAIHGIDRDLREPCGLSVHFPRMRCENHHRCPSGSTTPYERSAQNSSP